MSCRPEGKLTSHFSKPIKRKLIPARVSFRATREISHGALAKFQREILPVVRMTIQQKKKNRNNNIKNITIMAVNLTNDNAKEFMATELPIVLDFSAAWCGPCKQLAPIIEELSEEYAGRIAVGKCDIEEADDLTMEYGIRNVPTVIFIKNGQIVERFVGYKSKSDVQAKFEALLG